MFSVSRETSLLCHYIRCFIYLLSNGVAVICGVVILKPDESL